MGGNACWYLATMYVCRSYRYLSAWVLSYTYCRVCSRDAKLAPSVQTLILTFVASCLSRTINTLRTFYYKHLTLWWYLYKHYIKFQTDVFLPTSFSILFTCSVLSVVKINSIEFNAFCSRIEGWNFYLWQGLLSALFLQLTICKYLRSRLNQYLPHYSVGADWIMPRPFFKMSQP